MSSGQERPWHDVASVRLARLPPARQIAEWSTVNDVWRRYVEEAMKKGRRPHTDLPAAIADAIRQAWPEGVIDMPGESEDAPFWELDSSLKLALSRIRGGAVLYQREPRGGPRWDEHSKPDEDPPDWHDEPRSYGLFFVSSMDERLTFATDTVEAVTLVAAGLPARGASTGVNHWVRPRSLIENGVRIAQPENEVVDPAGSPSSLRPAPGGDHLPHEFIRRHSLFRGQRRELAVSGGRQLLPRSILQV